MSDLQLVPIRRLIDDVVLHGRRHWLQILPSVALMQFGIGLLALLLQEKQLQLAESPNPSPDEVFGLFAVIFPVLFIVMAVYMVAFSAVMVACMDALDGRPVNMARAWGFSLRPKVFLTNSLVWVLTTLSALCCILPVFVVGPILTFTLPLMVHRDIYGFKAVGESIELAKYNPTERWRDSAFLHILGVLGAGVLVNYAVSMLVQLPLIVMQGVMTFRQASSGDLTTTPVPPLWMQVPTQAMVALVTTASWIYWCFGIAALYREVLRRKDGGDLQDAIDQMTAGPGGGSSGGPAYPTPTYSTPPAPTPPASTPPAPTPPVSGPESAEPAATSAALDEWARRHLGVRQFMKPCGRRGMAPVTGWRGLLASLALVAVVGNPLGAQAEPGGDGMEASSVIESTQDVCDASCVQPIDVGSRTSRRSLHPASHSLTGAGTRYRPVPAGRRQHFG